MMMMQWRLFLQTLPLPPHLLRHAVRSQLLRQIKHIIRMLKTTFTSFLDQRIDPLEEEFVHESNSTLLLGNSKIVWIIVFVKSSITGLIHPRVQQWIRVYGEAFILTLALVSSRNQGNKI